MRKNFPKNDLIVYFKPSTQKISYSNVWSWEVNNRDILIYVLGNRCMKKQSNEMNFLVGYEIYRTSKAICRKK